jgi:hypothetical protein
LAGILSKNVPAALGSVEMGFCIQNLCVSLAKIYLKERDELDLPLDLNQLDWISFLKC